MYKYICEVATLYNITALRLQRQWKAPMRLDDGIVIETGPFQQIQMNTGFPCTFLSYDIEFEEV